MSSFGPGNKEIHGESVMLVPAAARATAGTGGVIVTGDRATLRLTLDVTAVSGTGPSLTVTIEHSSDGATWSAHSSFAAVTAVGTARKVFSGLDRYVRTTWAISGITPSFTFVVSGELV